MRSVSLRTVWLNIIGYTFLVLGVLGCFLPLLQGILFLLIGFSILSQTSPWAKRLFDKFEKRYPNIAKKSELIMVKLRLKTPVQNK